MNATRGRDSIASSWLSVRVIAAAWIVFVLLVALTACGDDGDQAEPTATQEQAAIVVSTIEPTIQVAMATETPAPPTVTPTPESTRTPTPPAPLAALVNGRYVFLADYERQVDQYEPALVELGVDLETPEGQAQLAEARLDVLETMIDHILIQEEAEKRGLELSGTDLATQVAADIEAGGGQDAFDGWLDTAGLNREDYERMLGESLVLQRVWDAITADVVEERDQVHARQIVVGDQEEAEAVLVQLSEGADFAALARERSLDLATAENGGDLGWFPRGTLPADLEAAAFALQPGQVSDVVAVDDSFHVIQVVEREVARPLTTGMLIAFKQLRFERWLAESRAEAEIERFVSD